MEAFWIMIIAAIVVFGGGLFLARPQRSRHDRSSGSRPA